jgi:hypothetical protein
MEAKKGTRTAEREATGRRAKKNLKKDSQITGIRQAIGRAKRLSHKVGVQR